MNSCGPAVFIFIVLSAVDFPARGWRVPAFMQRLDSAGYR